MITFKNNKMIKYYLKNHAKKVAKKFRNKRYKNEFICRNSPLFFPKHWEEFINSKKFIAEEKFAGEFWAGSESWWNVCYAEYQGKLQEVMNLKADFLEYIATH